MRAGTQLVHRANFCASKEPSLWRGYIVAGVFEKRSRIGKREDVIDHRLDDFCDVLRVLEIVDSHAAMRLDYRNVQFRLLPARPAAISSARRVMSSTAASSAGC